MWTELLPTEFVALWRRLGLGARPLELNVQEVGGTTDQARNAYREAWEGLAARGLVTGDDVDGRLADVLATLARPSVSVDLRWAVDPGRELRGLAAARGEWAAVGVLADGRVWTDTVRAEALVDAVVGLIGRTPRGSGRAVSVAARVLDEAAVASGEAGQGFTSALVEAGMRGNDARMLTAVVSAPRLRAGQLGAAARDGLGRRRRAPGVVNVFDTVEGRYALYERSGYVTVAPADERRITNLVLELLQSIDLG
ncbi:EspG family protein [Streptoalloteichus tenebrarius]|uniref:EspG family protein n=2 Tax=Streptoalloteichus tenebrarius (strain ATCC 17920 / DSM 40477 / JCM 4838 / CBS 697.72 / NBRC 16177 / NCIMB 11028 / NRRL B-12390 / A12253. 1 / ISP 5477) TaxID=1933 RepID=A0ABT1I0R0_STRSD|nr:EspG family protein [Streptoalloteichus tenebrarius]BFF00920.1 ESX secretion-associated protein EspG [Streptoalloteichus tenebrarius]